MDAESSTDRIRIDHRVSIPVSEITFEAIRAQGAGGQNVNKVSSAIHLRFEIKPSTLPEDYKTRLLQARDRRISKDGTIVIKAQRFRHREKNKQDALERLARLIHDLTRTRKSRKPTRPSAGARKRRLDDKQKRSRLKALRGTIPE